MIIPVEPHVSQGGRRQFGGIHGYGHRPFPVANSRVLRAPHRSYAAPPPNWKASRSMDFSDHVAALFDQGQTSSCYGHAGSGSLAVASALSANAIPFLPSPDDLYRGARCVDRAHEGRVGDPLEDIGTDPDSGIIYLARFGTRPMGQPVPGRFSDVSEDPAILNREPAIDELILDGQRLVTGVERIFPTSPSDAVAKFVHALGDDFKVITFGINVDEAFENYTSGVVTAPDPTKLLGGHALYAVGYETAADGSIVGIGVNSWGTGWGIAGAKWNGGFFRFDEAFIAAMSIIDVVEVK